MTSRKLTSSVTESELHIGDVDPFNVRLFGATGDGVTDDTASCQTAINEAEAAGGGVVQFPPGTYSINCVVNSDNVILQGHGLATKLLSDDATAAILIFENVDHCGMRDFFIDGEDVSGVEGVVLDGVRWSVFENIIGDRFTDPMLDLRADLNATQNTEKNTFIHCHVLNAVAFIRLSGNAGFTQLVRHNTFLDVSANGDAAVASTLIDFARGADGNHFVGLTRLTLNFAASIGVILNSDSAAAIRAVFDNHFDDLVINQTTATTVSIQVNDTRVTGSGPFASRIQHKREGSDATDPVIAANGHIIPAFVEGSFTDTTRPAPGDVMIGTQIWNSEDGFPNWSDGTNWVISDGTTT